MLNPNRNVLITLKNDHVWSFFNIIYTFLVSIFEPCFIQNRVITNHVIKRLKCMLIFRPHHAKTCLRAYNMWTEKARSARTSAKSNQCLHCPLTEWRANALMLLCAYAGWFKLHTLRMFEGTFFLLPAALLIFDILRCKQRSFEQRMDTICMCRLDCVHCSWYTLCRHMQFASLTGEKKQSRMTCNYYKMVWTDKTIIREWV